MSDDFAGSRASAGHGKTLCGPGSAVARPVDMPLVVDLADIEAITQQVEQGSTAERHAAPCRSRFEYALLADNVAVPEVPH